MMKKIKETIKDRKDFILLCVTLILFAGWLCISKIFDFLIYQQKESENEVFSLYSYYV